MTLSGPVCASSKEPSNCQICQLKYIRILCHVLESQSDVDKAAVESPAQGDSRLESLQDLTGHGRRILSSFLVDSESQLENVPGKE